MKIGTMSIIVGGTACNARCPFCISRTTPTCGIAAIPDDVNWRNFDKCCNCAVKSGAMTALLTGKGEPTLWPDIITEYLKNLKPWNFPFIELQTNGILLCQESHDRYLQTWYKMGLSTICISIVSPWDNQNSPIYEPHRDMYTRKLIPLIQKLRSIGFTVRLCCMLAKGIIEDHEGLEVLIDFARIQKVKQLTARPINVPSDSDGIVDSEVVKWIKEHTLSQENLADIEAFLAREGKQILVLQHGDRVFDIHGQNFCWGSCITNSKDDDHIRQIIFYPDGTMRWDWKYEGSVLL